TSSARVGAPPPTEIPAFAGMTRWGSECPAGPACVELSEQGVVEIVPVRVGFLDQFDLPLPAPFLDLLFARDGGAGGVVLLEVDEVVRLVAGRKTLNERLPVDVDSGGQVAG